MVTDIAAPFRRISIHFAPFAVDLYSTCHCSGLAPEPQLKVAPEDVIFVVIKPVPFWQVLVQGLSSIRPLQLSSIRLPQISAAPGWMAGLSSLQSRLLVT